MYKRKTSDICLSDKFKSILEKISDQSDIAKVLLRGRIEKSILVDENHINYISISDADPSKISYMSYDRAQSVSDDDIWISKKRYHVKYGGFVNKLFNCFNSVDVELFSNLMKSIVLSDNRVLEIVDGCDIIKYYNIDSYKSERGTLGASCMKYNKCGKYLRLYRDNTDIVKLLIVKDDDGLLIGRALLWYLGDHKIMDRIYTTYDEDIFLFKNWAKNNGFYNKVRQNWNDTVSFEFGGKKVDLRLDVDLSDFDYTYYPYMDTFKWLNQSNGTLYNYRPDNLRNVITISDPNGGYCGGDYLDYDDIGKCYQYHDNLVTMGYLSKKTLRNNTVFSNIFGDYILSSHSLYIRKIDDYIFNKENYQYNDVEKLNSIGVDINTNESNIISLESDESNIIYVESNFNYFSSILYSDDITLSRFADGTISGPDVTE